VPTGIQIAVLGAVGRPAATGEPGRVAIRGETVFAGYESNPEANAESFTDGWFLTGDEGVLDGDGYLFLQGRTKEIINRAGEKVAPAEVDDALLGHPDVVQAVSFAVPDERLGEEVGAAVVLREGSDVTARELQERVARRLADFKVPRFVVFVDDVPKGPTGKLQRIGLAETLGIAGEGGTQRQADYIAPRSELERELAELWAEILHVERVGLDDDFFSLGGDSILGAEVMARLGERTGRPPPLTTLMWAPTLGEFAELLEDGRWDDDARIVPVRTGGSRPPLFVTHGLGDEILNIGVLKRTLSQEQPLYAVRIVPHRFRYESVEDIARDYLDEIRAVQPSGPYRFASMCSGSAIVTELVRHASASGDEVALAVIIDPRDFEGESTARYYVQRTMLHMHDGSVRFAIRRKLRHWLAHVAPKRYPDPELEVNPLGPVLHSLRRHYRLNRLPGTLTVISTMDYDTPRSYWEEHADNVEWYEVEAPHVTIFQQPHADALGDVLDTVLREAEPACVR
jgi:thioesterase domain-containing protein